MEDRFTKNHVREHVSSFQWRTVWMIVWFCGVMLLVGKAFCAWHRLHLKLKDAQYDKDQIYYTEVSWAPFVFGFLKPNIYLPYHLSPEERQYVIYHEQMHIHRKDPLWKVIAYGICCLYWMNPCIWFAYYMMSKNMELSCDEAVINHWHVSRKQYAYTLLHLANEKQQLLAHPLSFSEGDAKNRIQHILGYRKVGFAISSILVMITLLLVMPLFTSPKPKPPLQDQEKQLRLHQNDADYLKQFYSHKDDRDFYNTVLPILDYGKDDTLLASHQQINPGEEGDSIALQLEITTTSNLDIASAKALDDEMLRMNANAIMALHKDVELVRYHLLKEDDSLDIEYYADDKGAWDASDYDQFIKTMEEMQVSVTIRTVNENAVRYLKSTQEYQALENFIPAPFWQGMDKVSMHYESVDAQTPDLYVFSKQNTDTAQQLDDYHVQLSFGEKGLTHYAFKYYAAYQGEGYEGKAINDEEAQSLVDDFIKSYRKDAAQLRFTKEAMPEHHLYEEGHMESWVAHRDEKTLSVMVDKEYGAITEAELD